MKDSERRLLREGVHRREARMARFAALIFCTVRATVLQRS
jgi:hypothetical protein